ncbi:hypothetical protein ROZALSC1DRAFT_30797, partial [Rozella allomycis CSF55]
HQSRLKEIHELFTDILQKSNEKLALATNAYNIVDKHVMRLDKDLEKFEEEMNRNAAHIVARSEETNEQPAKRRRRQVNKEKEVKERAPSPDNSVTSETQPVASRARRAAARSQRLREASLSKESHSRTRNTSSVRNEDDSEQSEKEDPAEDKEEAEVKEEKVEEQMQVDEPAVEEDETSEKKELDSSPRKFNVNDMPVDPNEPVYCYCKQVSYGEMIACDNDDCDVEWFHYDCVGLSQPPKGKWYCKECVEKRKLK